MENGPPPVEHETDYGAGPAGLLNYFRRPAGLIEGLPSPQDGVSGAGCKHKTYGRRPAPTGFWLRFELPGLNERLQECLKVGTTPDCRLPTPVPTADCRLPTAAVVRRRSPTADSRPDCRLPTAAIYHPRS